VSSYSEGPQLPIVKVVEMIGESPRGWEDAMREVVAEAQKTLRGISRVAVTAFDVTLKEDHIDLFRVRAAISFRLEGDSSPDYPLPYEESTRR
jgi:flavin-binding protein dodecin